MAEDIPLSEFDLADLPKDKAAKLVRERANQLGRQRDWAVLSMLGGDVSPELAKAGASQFGAANEEQRALEAQGGHVLNRALQQKQYERELAALNLQGEQIRGQLGIAQSQLQLSAMEPFIRSMLEAKTEEDKIKAIASHFGVAGEKVGEILSGPARAKGEAARKVLKETESVVGGKVPAAPGAKKRAAPAPVAPANSASVDDLMKKYLGTATK